MIIDYQNGLNFRLTIMENPSLVFDKQVKSVTTQQQQRVSRGAGQQRQN